MKNKNSKRILSVKVKRMIDTGPDTSYLGEYSNHPTSDFSIDRAHSEDCASLFPLTSEGVSTLEHAMQYINSLRIDSDLDTPEDLELQTAIATIEDLIAEHESPHCDCGEHGDMLRNEYRYFNPPVENYKGESPEDIRKYCRQDYERMESYNNQQWCYIGIRAEAEVQVADVIQRITSGGLWGIESDSDRPYLESVQQDELANLKTELLALGFSRRAISQAFKNVEEVSE